MSHTPDRSLRATAALLTASAVLLAASLAGLAASLPLAVACLSLGVVLFAVRDRLAAIDPVPTVRLGPLLAVAWVGVLFAGLVVLLSPTATTGELQALGGLSGLVGMANYFLRPVYAFLFSTGRSIGRTLD